MKHSMYGYNVCFRGVWHWNITNKARPSRTREISHFKSPARRPKMFFVFFWHKVLRLPPSGYRLGNTTSDKISMSIIHQHLCAKSWRRLGEKKGSAAQWGYFIYTAAYVCLCVMKCTTGSTGLGLSVRDVARAGTSDRDSSSFFLPTLPDL